VLNIFYENKREDYDTDVRNMEKSHKLSHFFKIIPQKYSQSPPEFICYQTTHSTECHVIDITKYGHLPLCVQ